MVGTGGCGQTSALETPLSGADDAAADAGALPAADLAPFPLPRPPPPPRRLPRALLLVLDPSSSSPSSAGATGVGVAVTIALAATAACAACRASGSSSLQQPSRNAAVTLWCDGRISTAGKAGAAAAVA